MQAVGNRRILPSQVSVPLIVLVGLCLTGALFWAAYRSEIQYSAPHWLILPVGLLLTALLAYLRGGLSRRTRAEASASELKFRRLLDDIPSLAVRGYDRNRRIIFWNTASERLYGYRRDEALGRLLEDLIIPLPLRPRVVQHFERWVREGRPIPCGELELTRKDGSRVPVYSSHVMLDNSRGEQELYCLDIDLSERKRAAAALDQRDILLEVAASTATRLLKEPDPTATIAFCFAQLGQATGADRVRLFENHACLETGALLMNPRHEWCAEGATSQLDNPEFQNLPYVERGFARWLRMLAANTPIAGRVRDFPEFERTALEQQDIISILAVPVIVRDDFWGFVELDDCHRERDWTPAEQNILQNIAGNLGEAIARQRAETALQDSEERFRRITDNMSDLVCQVDTDGTIYYASPSYRAVMGYKPLAMIGHSVFEGLHPDDREATMAIFRQSLFRVEVGQAEFRYRRADGAYLWLEANGKPLCDSAGRITGAVINCRDVTERKRAEEGLRLAAQVFENSREAIIITDAQTRVLSVNRAFGDITGYGVEEVIGQTPRLLASGRHDRDFYQAMWRALVADGHWQGEIWNRRKNGEIYPEWLGISAVHDAQARLTHYVGIFSDISERKAIADQIEFLAHHDPLTTLPNRLLLHDRLERALAQAERYHANMALLFLDLDRFKLVNDSLGHELGDQLLRRVATRLHQQLREVDTVGRQGSDEFLILLPDTGTDGADRVARNLLTCLGEQPFRIADHTLGVTASIGISLYPAHGRDGDTLLKQAGTALHYAKNGGGNTHRFFTAAMNVDALERLRLETHLRQALERGEFLLHYQPQLALASDRIVGVEALLRWRHPEWGLVSPGRFIPIAEDSGLIVPIGEWVLREACHQARVWRQAGLPRITVAVNLSALQFKQPDLLATVTQALTESGLEPESLELELTESILVQDVESTQKTLQQLRAMGVELSIDDFGTGYSSLSYLQKLAVHKLKIDQSFVRGLAGETESAAIIRAIIQLARSLKLITVAEGVETDGQLAFLRQQGCDQVQGYFIARPMPPEEFARLLAQPATSATMLAPPEPFAGNIQGSSPANGFPQPR